MNDKNRSGATFLSSRSQSASNDPLRFKRRNIFDWCGRTILVREFPALPHLWIMQGKSISTMIPHSSVTDGRKVPSAKERNIVPLWHIGNAHRIRLSPQCPRGRSQLGLDALKTSSARSSSFSKASITRTELSRSLIGFKLPAAYYPQCAFQHRPQL